MKEIIKTNSPVRGFSRLCLGSDTQIFGEKFKQYSFFIKLLGTEPEIVGEEIKVFTIGLFLLRQDNRVRAGFVKRHQTLLKA